MIGKLISVNPSKAASIDLSSSSSFLTLGRSADCSIKLDDNRCSGTHCRVSWEQVGNDWVVSIEDLSTNGTFLDGVKVSAPQIGKGLKRVAPWNSVLDILRTPQVDAASKIGFKLEKVNPDKRRPDPSDSGTAPKPAETKSSAIDDKIADTLKCQICMEFIFQPICLYPCLHSFCGGCYTDWHKRAKDCPSCRGDVDEVKKNHMVFSLVDTYLKSHPEAKRPQEELDELDKINEFKQDRVVLKKKSKEKSESSEEEEIKIPQPTRGRPIRPAVQPRSQNICKQCPKVFEGFKCGVNQQHLQCFNCKTFMPDRNQQQRCEICQRGFCNLYWRANKCRVGIQPVDNYIATVFTVVRPSALNENKFEQNVLLDYLRRKNLLWRNIAAELIGAMETNQWDIDLSTV
jgi:E3 ubiquitin-protein ligase CHFR